MRKLGHQARADAHVFHNIRASLPILDFGIPKYMKENLFSHREVSGFYVFRAQESASLGSFDQDMVEVEREWISTESEDPRQPVDKWTVRSCPGGLPEAPLKGFAPRLWFTALCRIRRTWRQFVCT